MLATIFVVLMILAILGYGAGFRSPPNSNYGPFIAGGSWFLLWLCVAILGWVMWNGEPAARALR